MKGNSLSAPRPITWHNRINVRLHTLPHVAIMPRPGENNCHSRRARGEREAATRGLKRCLHPLVERGPFAFPLDSFFLPMLSLGLLLLRAPSVSSSFLQSSLLSIPAPAAPLSRGSSGWIGRPAPLSLFSIPVDHSLLAFLEPSEALHLLSIYGSGPAGPQHSRTKSHDYLRSPRGGRVAPLEP